MNLAFHYLFALAMTCGPLAMLYMHLRTFERAAADLPRFEETRALLCEGLRRLAIVTLLCLAGLMLTITLLRPQQGGAPHGILVVLEMAVFHVLWWPFAVPVLRQADGMVTWRGAGSRTGDGSRAPGHESGGAPSVGDSKVRVAGLTPRRVSDDLSPVARVLPLLVGVVGVGFVGWRLFQVHETQGFVWQAAMFASGGIFVLLGYALWIRMEVRSPQPLVGSGEIARTYQEALEENRRFRVRAIFALEVLFAAVMFVVAFCTIEAAGGRLSGATIGILGGVGGSVIGILGSAMGIVGSVRMQKLRLLREQLSETS